jgi:hypothetical protein
MQKKESEGVRKEFVLKGRSMEMCDDDDSYDDVEFREVMRRLVN